MGRISEETIQRVAEANDIVEVIGTYFPLKRVGSSWRAICPFHREKTPSFHVNPQRQSYHCFGCGAGGTVFRFVMDYEHVDFPTAVRRLAQRGGIPVIEDTGGPQENERHELRKRLLAIHSEAALWFHQNLLKSSEAKSARDYLKGRGISGEIARSWQLGYALNSWDALPDMLREKGFSFTEILQSGLVSTKDDENRESSSDPATTTQATIKQETRSASQKFYARFRGRIMFPIRNDYGEVIAFSGRVLDSTAKVAKYVNSPETPIFTKGRILYGLDKSKRALINSNTAIVCEGQLDLISAFETGVQNVIAPQGTAFTPEQARLVRRFVETVVLCFDSDRAGQEAITRSLPALLECGVNVRVARLPEGEDPDSLIRKQGSEAFRNIVNSAKDFFDYAVEGFAANGVLEDPARKAAAARKLGPFVVMIKDQVLREGIVSKICTRLGITPSTFMKTLRSSNVSPRANSEDTIPQENIHLSAGMEMLCQLALTNPPVRDWLITCNDLSIASLEEGAHLLEKILHYPLSFEGAASLPAFLATLSPVEERTIVHLDLERQFEDPISTAKETWNGLIASKLRQKRDVITAQLRKSGLTSNQIAELQKQILDLQMRLNDLSGPLA